MIYIYPWHKNSKSARALRIALDGRLIRTEGSAFKGDPSKKVINWGSSTLPTEVGKATVLNPPTIVMRVANKLEFFNMMKASANPPRIPPFTTDLKEAIIWTRDGEKEVLARTKLTSHSGIDIIFSSDGLEGDFTKGKLYTKYIKKKAEFRVHFVADTVVDLQKKVLRKTDDNGTEIDPKTIDFRIRNHSNGFIFIREDIQVPDDVVTQARLAFLASGLDFGAVDVIWNEHENKAYVLEINTAPGLEGQTVSNYAERFQGLLNG